MSPLWLILICPVCAAVGLFVGALCASGAYTDGYGNGYRAGHRSHLGNGTH